jgi:hypothetical protein
MTEPAPVDDLAAPLPALEEIAPWIERTALRGASSQALLAGDPAQPAVSRAASRRLAGTRRLL